MHRPANVDDPAKARQIVRMLRAGSTDCLDLYDDRHGSYGSYGKNDYDYSSYGKKDYGYGDYDNYGYSHKNNYKNGYNWYY